MGPAAAEMDFDTAVKLSIYDTLARTTHAPTTVDVARALHAPLVDVEAAFGRCTRSACSFPSRAIRCASAWRRRSRACRRRSAFASTGRRTSPTARGTRWGFPPRCIATRRSRPSTDTPARRSRSTFGAGAPCPSRASSTSPVPAARVVGGHPLHLSDHAPLPVGRERGPVVPSPRHAGSAAGHARAALVPGRDVVRKPSDRRLTPTRTGRDGVDLLARRARGSVLGSALGSLGLGGLSSVALPDRIALGRARTLSRRAASHSTRSDFGAPSDTFGGDVRGLPRLEDWQACCVYRTTRNLLIRVVVQVVASAR